MTIEISPQEANAAVNAGKAVLIDVRTPAEYREKHASCAVNVPLDSLTKEAVTQISGSCSPIFICKSGTRGKQALERAARWGLSGGNVTGGTAGWEASGCDVVCGAPTMSLERQVRIAAGALVVLGTILGIYVSPWALAIPLFVGSGLVFAGATDTCGMGMLLARMPWNRR